MFTLLPQQFKENLMKEYRFRLLSVFCFLMLLLAVISLCLLLPTFISVSSEHTRLSLEEKSLADSIIKKDTDDFSKTLGVLKNDIELVATPDNLVSPIISSIYDYVLDGISINKIDYSLREDKSFTINLSGIASNRRVLSVFATELKNEKMFATVDLPISNLAKETELPFFITIQSSKEEI